MSPTNESDAHIREIREQPDAIRRASDAIYEQRSAIGRIADSLAGMRRIVLSGMGSSHDACFPAIEHIAERGVVGLHLNAGELVHFRRAWLTADTVLVVVSQSGKSAEVVRLADELAEAGERPLVVSVTNGLDNPLAARADVALDTRAGPETAPSSMTFAATLVHVGALARVLAGDEVDRSLRLQADAAEQAASAVEEVLRIENDVAVAVADVVRDRRIVAILGRGSARSTAEMGALTLKECGIVAEGFEAAAFRHGPFELAGPGLGAIVVATEEPTRPLELRIASELRQAGSPVTVLVDEPPVDDPDCLALPGVDRLMSPSVSIVPIQLGAHRLALEAGREPGSYAFATKVTTRE